MFNNKKIETTNMPVWLLLNQDQQISPGKTKNKT
jgi:hypothetical protein